MKGSQILILVLICFGLWSQRDAWAIGNYLGYDLAVTSYGRLDNVIEDLPGLHLFGRVGFPMSDSLSMEAEIGGTGVERRDLTFYGAGLRMTTWPESPVNPFFRGGWGRYPLTVETSGGDVKLSGFGYHYGAGFDVALSPRGSLGLGITRRVVGMKGLTRVTGGPPNHIGGDRTSIDLRWQLFF